LDWIKQPVQSLPSYAQFLKRHDWASTKIGPMEHWPDLLRHTAITITASPDPRLMLWGDELCILYNEPCLALIGHKHPSALGNGPEHVFAEIWPYLEGIVKLAMERGKATKVQELQLTINRDLTFGPEETYWSFTMLPIIGPDGIAVGALDEFTEATSSVIGERRMNTLIHMGENAAGAKGIHDLWDLIVEAFEPNAQDVPFALLYSVNAEDASSGPSYPPRDLESVKNKRCFLEASIGVPDGHKAKVESFVLTEGNEAYAGPFRRSWSSAQPVIMHLTESVLFKSLQELNDSGRGFGDPCKQALVLPIPPLSGTSIRGFLLLGLNPRRPYDEDYRIFVRLLNDRLIKAVASIFLPEEQRRSQELMDETNARHAKWERELQQKRREAESAEATFTKLAESTPIGCAVFQLDGHPTWMNQAFPDLTGLDREDFTKQNWTHTIIPEDRKMVEDNWKALAQGTFIKPFEFRVKRAWKSPDPTDGSDEMGHSWLLASTFAELDEEGHPQRILGWLTDISHQKWSQHLQARRLEDALETKRQSENFIDMTSHEMRNPLSAIIQSADGILASLKSNDNSAGNIESQDIIVDAAQTIVLCTQHQKRIVDDILTLSKLDSNLLVIAPDIIQPVALVERAIKMFEAEMTNSGIDFTLRIHQSYKDLAITSVLLDPSRVLQVLINLLTNAIKFTRNGSKRAIRVFLSAAYSRPTSGHANITYIPQRPSRPVHNFSKEWGSGQDIFLQFAVEDTGRGLTEDEMKLLFHRFSQASPKTYGQYGGSGLGLFISRELTELQGGQIGVASVAGEGSTFTFYIMARRMDSDAQSTTGLASPPQSPLYETRRITFRTRDSLPKDSAHARMPSTPTLETTMLPTVEWSSEPSVKPLHVLIVEDNFINQKVLAQQLKREGCVVHVANHGLEALSFLQRSCFAAGESDGCPRAAIPLSVVLMDLEMPVMDGLTCIKNIRGMQAAGELQGHVPVMAVTANARSEQIESAIACGMDEVVTKPFRIPSLIPRMERLVR
ncbi:hypothetical protein K490DRAFT_16186, partial [Saccharata proteae CBS 121410]